MQTVQLLTNGKIHIEAVKITRYNGPLGIVLGTYPAAIALQIKRENE